MDCFPKIRPCSANRALARISKSDGTPTSEKPMTTFLLISSPGHCSNLMTSSLSHGDIGVGSSPSPRLRGINPNRRLYQLLWIPRYLSNCSSRSGKNRVVKSLSPMMAERKRRPRRYAHANSVEHQDGFSFHGCTVLFGALKVSVIEVFGS
ncbi:hypothetical protein D3C75_575310 [compost metagenome]